MANELVPVRERGLPTLPPSAPPAPLSHLSGQSAPLAPPPMEAGKDVKLIMFLAAGWGALFYTSKVAGGERDMEKLTKEGGVVRFTFAAFLLLLIGVAASVLLWSGANAKTIKCNLCGAEVREWTNVDMKQEFSSLPFMIRNAMIGNKIPAAHYTICQGCRDRFNALLELTQSKDLEVIFGGGGGNG